MANNSKGFRLAGQEPTTQSLFRTCCEKTESTPRHGHQLYCENIIASTHNVREVLEVASGKAGILLLAKNGYGNSVISRVVSIRIHN